MTVTWVFAFRAFTNAARNGLPSGPVTLPVTVAPNAIVEMSPMALTNPRILVMLILTGPMIPPQRGTLRNRIGAEFSFQSPGISAEATKEADSLSTAIYYDGTTRRRRSPIRAKPAV